MEDMISLCVVLTAAGGTEPELAKSCSSVFASRQLPRRVTVTLPTTALALCDYCFPDESEEVRTVETNSTAHRAAHWGCKAGGRFHWYVTRGMCVAGLQGKSG